MKHELKIWPEHYQAILDGRKRFEIRSTEDRSFDEGDLLHLREWDPSDPPHYTGREMTVRVSLVYAGIGVAQEYVVMGIQLLCVIGLAPKTKSLVHLWTCNLAPDVSMIKYSKLARIAS